LQQLNCASGTSPALQATNPSYILVACPSFGTCNRKPQKTQDSSNNAKQQTMSESTMKDLTTHNNEITTKAC